MKKCPYCAEDIQDAAVVCKHCGRDLGERPAQVQMPKVVKVRQADWISTIAKWGVGIFFVVIGIGWCASLVSPPQPAARPAAATPTPSSGPITAEDMKREKTGRFGTRKVSALEKDGTWIVTFQPALPRNDRTVLDAAEYALHEFLNVNINNTNWRPAGKFLRILTGSGAYDVLLMKNDNGTVHSMTVTKR